MIRAYSEMIQLETFDDRLKYLSMKGGLYNETFGHARYLNQKIYQSLRWRRTRDKVIIRDSGCDLGIEGLEIDGKIIVHHINPLTRSDIINNSEKIYDLNNLVCTTHNTHQAIHYGTKIKKPEVLNIRKPGDTCPWKEK